MNDILNIIVCAVVAATLCSCSRSSDEVSGHHVPVVSSDDRTSELAQMSVQLLGSVGTEIDSSGRYMFGRIVDIDADTVGNLYVLDAGFGEIKIFRDRDFVRRIYLPDGRGPGEYLNPLYLSVSPGGERILVEDRSPPRVTTIGPTGEYYSSFLAFRPYFDIAQSSGGNLLQVQMPMALRAGEPMVRTLTAKGEETGNSFGFRQSNYQQLFDEGIRSGIPFVCIDILNNLLFIAYGYPYEVQAWSTTGELRERFSRSIPGFDQTMERSSRHMYPARLIIPDAYGCQVSMRTTRNCPPFL